MILAILGDGFVKIARKRVRAISLEGEISLVKCDELGISETIANAVATFRSVHAVFTVSYHAVGTETPREAHAGHYRAWVSLLQVRAANFTFFSKRMMKKHNYF